MTKHWNPDEELVLQLAAEERVRAAKRPLPPGAVAGLVLVASCCFAVGVVLYQFAGPRAVVEEGISR